MKKYLYYVQLFLTIVLFFKDSSLLAEIVEFKSISQIVSHISPDTLVLLDIDNTVIELPQTLGTPQWFSDYYNKKRKLGMKHEEAMKSTVEIYTQVNEISAAKLVEQDTGSIIKTLQNRGIAVMGLTSRDDALLKTTIRQLESVGVNFNNGVFKDFQANLTLGERSKIKQGIIFTGGKHKGECLLEFLSLANWSPKKIIFVDDQLKNVQEVEVSLLKTPPFINYKGVRYSFLDDKIKNVDSKLHEVQLDYFNKTNRILSDQEAQVHLDTIVYQ